MADIDDIDIDMDQTWTHPHMACAMRAICTAGGGLLFVSCLASPGLEHSFSTLSLCGCAIPIHSIYSFPFIRTGRSQRTRRRTNDARARGGAATHGDGSHQDPTPTRHTHRRRVRPWSDLRLVSCLRSVPSSSLTHYRRCRRIPPKGQAGAQRRRENSRCRGEASARTGGASRSTHHDGGS